MSPIERGREILARLSRVEVYPSRIAGSVGLVFVMTATAVAEDYFINVKPAVDAAAVLADNEVCKPMTSDKRGSYTLQLDNTSDKGVRMQILSIIDDDDLCIKRRERFVNRRLNETLSGGRGRIGADLFGMFASYFGVLISSSVGFGFRYRGQ